MTTNDICERCGEMAVCHPVTVEAERDGETAVITDMLLCSDCQYDELHAAIIRVITGTSHPAVAVSREIVRNSFNSDEDYQQWLASLPALEQEQDETIAFFLQGTGW